MNNVRNYTTKQLLDRYKSLDTFKYVPKDIHLMFVRSNEDGNDIPDDKCYVFNHEECIDVIPCTTNKGNKGTAVMLSNHINYDAHKFGLHRKKMRALRQIKEIPYQRDFTKDGKTNPTGTIFRDVIFMNIHGMTYNEGSKIKATKIGGWSEGCLALADNEKYEKMIDMTEHQKAVTSVVLDEWTPKI
jgi:hypothetical protein